MARLRLSPRGYEAQIALFLRQSLRSDYCAIYATAMALSLLDSPVGRRAALRMFRAAPGEWYGASHMLISKVVQDRLGRPSPSWHSVPASSSKRICDALARAVKSGRPSIVTAYCIHRRLQLRCGHAFVLMDRTSSAFRFMDPLSPAPSHGAKHNATLNACRQGHEGKLRIDGAPWDLVISQTVSVSWLTLPAGLDT